MASVTARREVRSCSVLHRSTGTRRSASGEPYTRQLRGKLRELRFYLASERVRVTYYIARDRRIVLLTMFRKTRRQEVREINCAARAMQLCIAHGHETEEVNDC